LSKPQESSSYAPNLHALQPGVKIDISVQKCYNYCSIIVNEMPAASAELLRDLASQLGVSLGINLGDVGPGMAQHDLGTFQAEFLADSGTDEVSQLIRGPVWDSGLGAGLGDRPGIGHSAVALSGGSLGTTLSPVLLRRLDASLAIRAA